MHHLHHSDIITYAITRVAKEFKQDKESTLAGLRQCIDNANHRRGLGLSHFDLLDDADPGYSLSGNKVSTEEKELTSDPPRK
jgi:hypothetical protein